MKIVNTGNDEGIKTTDNSQDYVKILLIICGIILVIIGIFSEIPSRELNFGSITEYVGGDAYNGMIEASIRGGEIAGAMITQAIYICSGLIIIALGCLRVKKDKTE